MIEKNETLDVVSVVSNCGEYLFRKTVYEVRGTEWLKKKWTLRDRHQFERPNPVRKDEEKTKKGIEEKALERPLASCMARCNRLVFPARATKIVCVCCRAYLSGCVVVVATAGDVRVQSSGQWVCSPHPAYSSARITTIHVSIDTHTHKASQANCLRIPSHRWKYTDANEGLDARASRNNTTAVCTAMNRACISCLRLAIVSYRPVYDRIDSRYRA